MYIKDPAQIESDSMDIIGNEMPPHSFNEQELLVVKRMIHTTGDFEYQEIVRFNHQPIASGIKAIQGGCRVVTDTMMAYSGINKRMLEKAKCTIDNYVADDEAFRMAKEKGTTRSMAAIDLAAEKGVDIFVIGNAPTALYRIGELIQTKKISPQLVIGVPVGFVGAAESKEYIRGFDYPTITTKGRKGGSNVAAAVLNAIIYAAVGRDA